MTRWIEDKKKSWAEKCYVFTLKCIKHTTSRSSMSTMTMTNVEFMEIFIFYKFLKWHFHSLVSHLMLMYTIHQLSSELCVPFCIHTFESFEFHHRRRRLLSWVRALSCAERIGWNVSLIFFLLSLELKSRNSQLQLQLTLTGTASCDEKYQRCYTK